MCVFDDRFDFVTVINQGHDWTHSENVVGDGDVCSASLSCQLQGCHCPIESTTRHAEEPGMPVHCHLPTASARCTQIIKLTLRNSQSPSKLHNGNAKDGTDSMIHGYLIDNWTVNMSTDTAASDEGVSPAQPKYLSLFRLFGAVFVMALIWSVSPRTPIARQFVFYPLDN